MKLFFLLSILLLHSLHAQLLISPIDAMKENFALDAKISKKNILLTKTKFQSIQHNAKVKLHTKIYRIYTALKNKKVLGYGILINRKVRSKNAVILYMISKGVLQDIEIIAFNEPKEYLPTKGWNMQFHNTSTQYMLRLSRDIPSISGATLSARSVTEASRIAFALYNQILKDK